MPAPNPASAFLRLPRAVQGMALMLMSSLVFTIGNAVLKHLSPTVPPFELVFFRSLFSLIILAPFVWRAGGLKTLKTERLGLHGLRGVLQTISMLMFFAGIATTPLVLVNALEFTAPIFATLLAVFVFREQIHLRRTLALLAGFAGTLLALWPELQEGGFEGLGLGQILILISAWTWAGVLLTIRELGKTESSVTQSVYAGLVLTPLSGILAAFVWVTPTWTEFGWILVVSCTATFGQLAYIQSFRMAEMSVLLPLDFSKIIWSAALGYLIFAEVPAVMTILGGTIIFAAGTYITLREARMAKAPVREPIEAA